MTRSSEVPVPHRVDDPRAAARIVRAQLDRGAGIVIAIPVPADRALDRDTVEFEIEQGQKGPAAANVRKV